ncbi:MAG: PIN domain-containing protein [Candidatus Eremiobacterota bacterium]
MIERVFFDTGAIYAYMNIKDHNHNKIKSFIDGIKGKLVITNYIFDEIITLIMSRTGHKIAVKAGNLLLNSSQIYQYWINQNDEKDGWKLFLDRDDKEYSFTDCISFVVMRKLNIKKCLTTDKHFRQEGFEIII